jgi:hypothetical protein
MQVHFQVSGPTYAPRYIAWRSDETFWTGSEWVANRYKAMVYEDKDKFCELFHKLQAAEFEGCPTYEFKAEVTVRVVSATPVSEADVRAYLEKSFQMHLDGENGRGPNPDSCTEVILDWDNLKPATK